MMCNYVIASTFFVFFFSTKEKNEGAADVAVVAIVNEENTKKDLEKNEIK